MTLSGRGCASKRRRAGQASWLCLLWRRVNSLDPCGTTWRPGPGQASVGSPRLSASQHMTLSFGSLSLITETSSSLLMGLCSWVGSNPESPGQGWVPRGFFAAGAQDVQFCLGRKGREPLTVQDPARALSLRRDKVPQRQHETETGRSPHSHLSWGTVLRWARNIACNQNPAELFSKSSSLSEQPGKTYLFPLGFGSRTCQRRW